MNPSSELTIMVENTGRINTSSVPNRGVGTLGLKSTGYRQLITWWAEVDWTELCVLGVFSPAWRPAHASSS